MVRYFALQTAESGLLPRGDHSLPPLDPRAVRTQPPLSRVRARNLDSSGWTAGAPGSDLVPARTPAKRLRRKYGSGFSGLAPAVCPVPPPPIREMEPGRLLRTGRV